MLNPLIVEAPQGVDVHAYKQVTPKVFILEHRIIPTVYRDLSIIIRTWYRPVQIGGIIKDISGDDCVFNEYNDKDVYLPHSWWLNLRSVPNNERIRWPKLGEEHNREEAKGLMEFIELFEWVPAKMRFCIRKEHRRWVEE